MCVCVNMCELVRVSGGTGTGGQKGVGTRRENGRWRRTTDRERDTHTNTHTHTFPELPPELTSAASSSPSHPPAPPATSRAARTPTSSSPPASAVPAFAIPAIHSATKERAWIRGRTTHRQRTHNARTTHSAHIVDAVSASLPARPILRAHCRHTKHTHILQQRVACHPPFTSTVDTYKHTE